MTFKKGFFWGYLVFVLVIVIIYFTIQPKYGFYALITLSILFGLYQAILSLKVRKARKR